jgi:hypothetical protein
LVQLTQSEIEEPGMNQNETNLITRVAEQMRESFGDLVMEPRHGLPVQISFPGHAYLVCIWPLVDEREILRVVAPVTEHAAWETSGLAEFLLREAGTFVFGRLERCGDGITLEHALLASASVEELSVVVRALAHCAVQLERDLALMGALSPDDMPTTED